LKKVHIVILIVHVEIVTAVSEGSHVCTAALAKAMSGPAKHALEVTIETMVAKAQS
jgi:hypothetical protein